MRLDTTLLISYIDGVDRIVALIVRFLGKYIRVIRIGPIEFQLKREFAKSYEETFKKITEAQNNLSEAVDALDNLRSEYLGEKNNLEKLLNDVKKKKEEYENTTEDLELTKDLLNEERERLKRVMGIDDTRSKVMGFVSGVFASIFATAIWIYGPQLWILLLALLNKAQN